MLLPTTKASWLLQIHNRAIFFCLVLLFLVYQHHELAEGTELWWHFVAPMRDLNFRAHKHFTEAILTSCSFFRLWPGHGPRWKTPKQTLGFSQPYMALWTWRSLSELYNSVSWYYSQSQLLFLFTCSTPASNGFFFTATQESCYKISLQD